MGVVHSNECTSLRMLDDTVRVLQRSADSPNRMSVMNVEVPSESGGPPHSHALEEEAYFVLDGVLQMTVDGAIDEFFVAMSRSVRRMPEDAPTMQALLESFGVRAIGAPTSEAGSLNP